MRHAILGAGGVGGVIAAPLVKAGESVTMIVRPERMKDYPAEITLDSTFGTFSVPVSHAAAVSEAYDVLWVSVKATQLDAALRTVAVAPESIGAVVPLLNGMVHVELLRGRFGHDRVVPATIAVEAERPAPGKFLQRGMGVRIAIASLGKSRLASAGEAFQTFGYNFQFADDEMKILWTKLSFLAPFALTTTAAGLPIGGINSDPIWKKRLEGVVREVAAVGTASGTPLDANAILPFYEKTPQTGRSSMQKDVAAGNPPEIDGIAGPILRRAAAYGIDVPVTKELVEMIRQKAGGLKAASTNP